MAKVAMTVKILELAGKRWAIMPEKDYKRLAAHAGEKGDWPALPKPDAQGNFPAVEYARASLSNAACLLECSWIIIYG